MEYSASSHEFSIAVTGIGCMFPKASGTSAFWANITSGIDCLTEIPDTHWRIDDYFDPDPDKPDHTHARTGGFLDPVAFDPMEFGIAPNALEAIDTSQLLTLLAAKQALRDAGYDNGASLNKDRVSVILGVTGAQQLVIPLGARLYHPLMKKTLVESGLTEQEADEIVRRVNHRLVGWQEASFPGLLGNVVAGRIANRFDFGGTNCVVDAACAGSLASVHTAMMELQTHKADMVLTGGVDTFNDIFMYMCFSKTKALSPTGHARPFDTSADGTAIGEGVGVITLKRLADAERDHDRIYAVIRGIGTSSDGRGNAIYAPSAAGQKKALTRAYTAAGITPDTIEMVEAHGTGTPVGDAIELEALSEVYRSSGTHTQWCALGSVKSQIGHGKAAAGIAGLIKAALALHHRVIPPIAKVSSPTPALAEGASPFYLPTRSRPWLTPQHHPRRAAVSSFGFGGSNFHCVLEEHTSTPPDPDWNGSVQIAAFSDKNTESLIETLRSGTSVTTANNFRSFAQTTRKQFNPDDPCRLLMILTDPGQLAEMLSTAQDRIRSAPDTTWETPDGMFYGFGKPPGNLAAVFPGQGNQYPDMLLDTACRFPVFRETLENADRAFAENAAGADTQRLSNVIYPLYSFSEEQKNEQIETLKLTQYAQPGIGAVSIGAWQVLTRHFGLAVDAAAGHSYGEICALYAAGMITMQEFHHLSSLRGRLMSSGNSDRGSMAAVQASADDILTVLKDDTLNLVIANKNAPAQSVISGHTAEIQKAVTCFRKRGITITPLKVSAAFHSPLVADASKPFGKYLDNITFQNALFPVYSNTTGNKYPAQQKKIRDILASQLEKPVEFVNEIKQMAADGIRTFFEIGPGKRMTGLIRSILDDSNVRLIALDSSSGKRSGQVDMARALAALSSLGYSLNLNAWDSGFAPEPVKTAGKMQVVLTGTNYVRPKEPLPPFTIQRSAAPSTPDLSVGGISGVPASRAFESIQQNLANLQRLQEQTALLHQTFLTGQLEAQQAFQHLIAQQQHVLTGAPGQPAIPASSPGNTARSGLPDLPFSAGPPPVEFPTDAAPVSSRASVHIPDKPLPEQDTRVTRTAGSHALTTLVLGVVAEKTGYPVDLLEPDMELDADLGIDSIKRVEIMSALQEKLPDMPPVAPEHMASIRSLNDIVSLLAGTGQTGITQSDVRDSESRTEIPADKPAAKTSPFDTKPIRFRQTGESSGILDRVRNIIADKTGYPTDLLEADMELDADLGIDSIKRVEIMSALQEAVPGLPAIKPDQLAGLRTIRDIAGLVGALEGTIGKQTLTPDNIQPAPVPPETTPARDSTDDAEPPPIVTGTDTETSTEFTAVMEADTVESRIPGGLSGLPETMYRMDRKILYAEPLGHDQRQAISLPEHAEIWITRDDCGLSELLLEELENRYVPVRIISLDYLEFVELPNEVASLVIVGPRDSCDMEYLNKLFNLIQLVSPKIRRYGTDTDRKPAIVSLLRLDGALGLHNTLVDYRPLTAALAGLVKTIRLEWPETHCRIIDVDADGSYEPDIRDLTDELFLDGPFETGISSRGKVRIVMRDEPVEPEQLTREPLARGDWILATGGAKGVTAACVIEIARRFHTNVVLVGRSNPPEPEPEWLAELSQESEIKQAIASRSETRLSPRELMSVYAQHMSNREILSTIETLKSLNVEVRYESADLTDPMAVREFLDRCYKQEIILSGLIHGAGVIVDKLIEDKQPDDFDRVIRTKVESLRYLAENINLEMLNILVLFSSSTARFGRAGQVDYAMANEVLNKFAAKVTKMYPSCRTISINWGPWDGGMVTPELKKLFLKEGVDVIDIPSGARHLTRELRMDYGSSGHGPAEIVILGTHDTDRDMPGDSMTPDTATHERGSSDASQQQLPGAPPVSGVTTVIRPVTATSPEPILNEVFRLTLSTKHVPVLKSHLINNRPVVPMALLMEWAAAGAIKHHSNLMLQGLENFRLLKGIILKDNEPIELECKTGLPVRDDHGLRLPVELRGIQPNGTKFVHVTTDAILTHHLPEAPLRPPPLENPEPYPVHQAQLYNDVLFHGEMLQSIRRVEGVNENGISGAVDGAPGPAEWLEKPLTNEWITDPLSIDAAFQLQILWTNLMLDMPSLPCGMKRYTRFVEHMPSWGNVEIRVRNQKGSQVFSDIFFFDPAGQMVAVIEEYECIIDKGLRDAFRAHRNT